MPANKMLDAFFIAVFIEIGIGFICWGLLQSANYVPLYKPWSDAFGIVSGLCFFALAGMLVADLPQNRRNRYQRAR